ncbi:hypothetical protein JL721_12725 [Aureococcus anophagefferens]|nr:hypothetical protein JL721_12725 [Aureococcus anophagefferens]
MATWTSYRRSLRRRVARDERWIPVFTGVITTLADGAWFVFAIDVDGDGDVDVLSASYNDDTVAGLGGRRFVFFAVDVDGDGDVDALSANRYENTIAWYENDGGQSFTMHLVTAMDGPRPTPDDVDGDGDLDVLAASYDGEAVAWYENDGSRSFTAANIIATSLDGGSMTYDRLRRRRRRGRAGVVLVGPAVAWYENDGAQSFNEQIITTAASGANGIDADVDGDGDVDAVGVLRHQHGQLVENDCGTARRRDRLGRRDGDVGRWRRPGRTPRSRYENDGAQSFNEQIITTAASNANGIDALDVDGDGDVDALSASFGTDTVSWWENDCGTASPTSSPEPSSTPSISSPPSISAAPSPSPPLQRDGARRIAATFASADSAADGPVPDLDAAGSKICIECDNGTYSSSGLTCLDCGVGHYPDKINCLYCDGGAYSDGDRNDVWFFVSGEGATAATPCPPGSRSDNGATACGSAAAATTRTTAACRPLPLPGAAATSGVGGTYCDVCIVGYYWNTPYWATTGQPTLAAAYDPDDPEAFADAQCADCCVECPDEGSDCDEPGVVLEELPLKSNWWRASLYSDELYECRLTDACKGGSGNGSSGVRYCTRGHENAICSSCRDDYMFDAVANRCVACAHPPWDVSVSVGKIVSLSRGDRCSFDDIVAEVLFFIGLLIAMLSHRIYSGVEPFINDDDDIIAEVAQTQLVLVFFANLLLYVGEHTEDEASFATNLFGVVLVLVMSAGAFAAIYYILVDTFGEDKVRLEEAKASSRSLLTSVSKSARAEL